MVMVNPQTIGISIRAMWDSFVIPGLSANRNYAVVGETVRRERRWTSAGATPARELVRSTR